MQSQLIEDLMDTARAVSGGEQGRGKRRDLYYQTARLHRRDRRRAAGLIAIPVKTRPAPTAPRSPALFPAFEC